MTTTQEFDKKVKEVIKRIRSLHQIEKFSIDKELNLIVGDTGDSDTMLLEKEDLQKASNRQLRNALFAFCHDLPPEVARRTER